MSIIKIALASAAFALASSGSLLADPINVVIVDSTSIGSLVEIEDQGYGTYLSVREKGIGHRLDLQAKGYNSSMSFDVRGIRSDVRGHTSGTGSSIGYHGDGGFNTADLAAHNGGELGLIQNSWGSYADAQVNGQSTVLINIGK